jgi:hypothetical protein
MPANLKPQSKDYITRVSARVDQQLNGASTRIAEKLKPQIQSGDGQSMSTADWHQMIRSNWGDPEWRAKQAFRMGPVKFVQDALAAYGLKPGVLADNAEAINLGLHQHGNDVNAAVQGATGDLADHPAPDIAGTAPLAAPAPGATPPDATAAPTAQPQVPQ